MDPFIGELRIFPYNFIPKGWAACDGTLLNIQANTALFSLLNTRYGGDGNTTFALPDLRGRVPVHFGKGYILGQAGGASTSTLTTANLPQHTHALVGTNNTADNPFPDGNLLAMVSNALYALQDPTKLSAMAAPAISSTGASVPVSNMQPYLGLTICIATTGIYPPHD